MKTQGRRPVRVGEMIRMEISQLLVRELKDPRIGLTTVTEVKMSPDLKQARVYVSVLGGAEERQKTLAGLNSAASHIRHAIGERLRLRNTPELTFCYDQSIEYGAKIEELILKSKQSTEPMDES
jgi:ribosome-binding factor A